MRAGNSGASDDLIVSTVDYKRGACNSLGLSAYINSQIQLDLTCNPLPIGESHVCSGFGETRPLLYLAPIIICAARSAITIVGAFVLPLIIVGMIDTSVTRPSD